MAGWARYRPPANFARSNGIKKGVVMKKSYWFLLVVTAAVILAVGGMVYLGQTGKNTPKVATNSGSPWGADYFPNIPLVTQDGETVHFFDDLIKDKVVMINLIYTTCRDTCPLETARLKVVQKILGDRVGKDIFLYSISIDPKHDTPEVLKAYAEKFRIGPGWLFLTGKEDDIVLLRKKLGVYREDEDRNANFDDHDISLVIGNQKTGQWIKSSPFDNPHMLAEKVGSWLHNWKMPTKNERNYADAPKLRDLSRGESLFRTRCVACHTIGGGDLSQSEEGDVGPDLLGVVQKRDRGWLERFLAEPDKMIEEKDPLALSLLEEYNNLPMPNLRLGDIEIEALLKFIEEETSRVEPKEPVDVQEGLKQQ